MNNRDRWRAQTALMLKCLPNVMSDDRLALHGGTALNMFYFNMLRYSVDIDLTWIPKDDFGKFAKEVWDIFEKSFPLIEKMGYKIKPKKDVLKYEIIDYPFKTFPIIVKVEVSRNKRETLESPSIVNLAPNVITEFQENYAIQCINKENLFGDKLYVGMLRQNSRDIFDSKFIKESIDIKNISDRIRESLIFNIVKYDNNGRTLADVVNPKLFLKEKDYHQRFDGLQQRAFSYDDFLEEREKHIRDMHLAINEEDKNFILSVQNLKPRRDVYDFDNYPSFRSLLKCLTEIKEKDKTKYIRDTHNLEKALSNPPTLEISNEQDFFTEDRRFSNIREFTN